MTAEELIKDSEKELKEQFERADEVSEYNQEKVLKAFQKNRVALRHFNPSTGYGYGDEGRFVLGDVFADCFGAEAGIVSPAMLSGTHALTVALFGVLRPGDSVLAVSGMPLRYHSRRIFRRRKRIFERFRNFFRKDGFDGNGKV